jgi:hypothetical protein
VNAHRRRATTAARHFGEEGEALVAREGSLGQGDALGPARRAGVVVSRAVHGGPRWWKTELSSGAYRSGQWDGDADETQGEGSFYSRASCKGNAGLCKGNGTVWHAASRAGSAWWQSVACTRGGWAQQEGHGEEICSYVVVLATLERVK